MGKIIFVCVQRSILKNKNKPESLFFCFVFALEALIFGVLWLVN